LKRTRIGNVSALGTGVPSNDRITCDLGLHPEQTQISAHLVQVDTATARRLTNKRVNLVTPPGAIQLKD